MRGRLLADNAREQPWAYAVAWKARAVGVRPASGPMRLVASFAITRPKRPTHAFPARDDLDKLLRSVFDALTGVAWIDDQQVVDVVATKSWAGEDGPGATITVEPMEAL